MLTPPDFPPARVVSLVPSLTESLFDLGFGDSVVGVTDYCLYPADGVRGLPHLGGTKNPRIADIVALQPDLVLANREENTPATVKALQEAGLRVWVTFPKTVAEAMDVLWAFSRMYKRGSAVAKLQTLERVLDVVEETAAMRPPTSFFCPIWQESTADGRLWWMTFNRETYPHDLLTLLGGYNVFAGRQRRYPLEADLGTAEPQPPGERDTRYPRVTVDEVRAAQPELILLPGEPYAFGLPDRDRLISLLPDVPAVRDGRVYLVDGTLITWHGTRLGRALQELPPLFG
ncbi:MAG: helical backbone metal receptor [Anaerolineales bacterium]